MSAREKQRPMAKCYKPSKWLVEYMVERLQLDIRERKEISGGGQIKESLKLEGNIRVKKIRVLDRIFQDMADLTFFFRAISSHPELEKIFEKDMEDLVGLRHYGRAFLDRDSKAILPTLLLYLVAKEGDNYRKSVISVMLNRALNNLANELSRDLRSPAAVASLKADLDRVRVLGDLVKPESTSNRRATRKQIRTHFEADRVFQNPWLRVKEPKDEDASIDVIGDNGKTIHSFKVT